jgi:hypothetical protein
VLALPTVDTGTPVSDALAIVCDAPIEVGRGARGVAAVKPFVVAKPVLDVKSVAAVKPFDVVKPVDVMGADVMPAAAVELAVV